MRIDRSRRPAPRVALLLLMLVAVATPGCIAKKVISLPLRVTGAVVSVVPLVGGVTHDAMDAAADTID